MSEAKRKWLQEHGDDKVFTLFSNNGALVDGTPFAVRVKVDLRDGSIVHSEVDVGATDGVAHAIPPGRG